MAETTKQKGGIGRRTLTLIWTLVLVAVVITLLAYERVDILYVLASVGLLIFLPIVAMSKLEGEDEANRRKAQTQI